MNDLYPSILNCELIAAATALWLLLLLLIA